MQDVDFQPISLIGRVEDRQGRPVPGARVSLVAELEGEAQEADGTVHPFVQRLTRKATTAAYVDTENLFYKLKNKRRIR